MTVVARSSGSSRTSQLLRGVLDMCLLALIAEQPRYGYEVAETLQARGLELIAEGSIYPLLARLEKQRLVETYRQPSPAGGPPRKYYRITPAGSAQLEQWQREWRQFVNMIAKAM